MKTTFKYEITDFKEVENPKISTCLDTKKKRIFKYSGIIKGELIFWDQYGECRNLMWNDYFIDKHDFLDYLYKKWQSKQ